MQTYYTLSQIGTRNGITTATVTTEAARNGIQPDGILSSGVAFYGEEKAAAILEAVRARREFCATRTPGRKPRTQK
jgi:hypothetical protein